MRLSLSKEKMDFLASIGIEDRNYSQSEIDDVVIDSVVGYLMSHGWRSIGEETNEIGELCESIIDEIEGKRYDS